MNIELFYSIVSTIIMLLIGGCALYLKYNKRVIEKATGLIAQAEYIYKDTTKAGGKKFAWVVDTLYTYIPAPLKIILPKSMVEKIVQNVFDAIEDYAKTQVDKITNKI